MINRDCRKTKEVVREDYKIIVRFTDIVLVNELEVWNDVKLDELACLRRR